MSKYKYKSQIRIQYTKTVIAYFEKQCTKLELGFFHLFHLQSLSNGI